MGTTEGTGCVLQGAQGRGVRAWCSPADLGEGVRHRLAALEQPIEAVRLLLEELDGFHLHPQHHPHLALQAGELGWGGRVGGSPGPHCAGEPLLLPSWQCQGTPRPPKPPRPPCPWHGHPARRHGMNPGEPGLVSLLLPMPIIPPPSPHRSQPQPLAVAPPHPWAPNAALEPGAW